MQAEDVRSIFPNLFNLNLFLSDVQLLSMLFTVMVRQPEGWAVWPYKGKLSQSNFSQESSLQKMRNQSRWLQSFYKCGSQSGMSACDYTSIYHSDGSGYWLLVTDSEDEDLTWRQTSQTHQISSLKHSSETTDRHMFCCWRQWPHSLVFLRSMIPAVRRSDQCCYS